MQLRSEKQIGVLEGIFDYLLVILSFYDERRIRVYQARSIFCAVDFAHIYSDSVCIDLISATASDIIQAKIKRGHKVPDTLKIIQ